MSRTTLARRGFGVAVMAAAGMLVVAGCDLGVPADVYQVTAKGNSASDVAVGDLDHDGHVDVVTAVNGGYAVGINDGSGKFTVTRTTTASAPGWLITLGDVNGDGHLDLVYLAGTASNDPPQIEVRDGDGAGHFAATATVLPAGDPPRSAPAVGDLNGDGRLDVAATTSTGVDVWLNDGSGGFAPPVAVATGANAGVVIADMDRDGVPDLVTGGFSPDAVVSVDRGDGTGGFSAPVTYGLGPVSNFGGTTTVGVADLNGDGIPDVYGGAAAFDQVFVFLGASSPGSVSLGPAILSPSLGSNTADIVAADIDVDGHPDLVTAGAPGTEVLFGDGAGHFPDDHSVIGGVVVATADFDGNGQPDLVYAQAEVERVLLNHMDGSRTKD